MVKSKQKQETEQMTLSIHSMTMEECEQAPQQEIDAMELEERVAELKERHDRLAKKRTSRIACSRMGGTEDSVPSRDRKSSRSSSSTRHRRRKWALKHYTVANKEIRKLNPHGLKAAVILWCLDIDGLTLRDHRAFLKHLHFLSVRAMTDDFKDAAHVAYDTAICKNVEVYGFIVCAAPGHPHPHITCPSHHTTCLIGSSPSLSDIGRTDVNTSTCTVAAVTASDIGWMGTYLPQHKRFGGGRGL